MQKLTLFLMLCACLASCGSSGATAIAPTPQAIDNSAAQTASAVEPEEEIAPLSEDFPDINDPSSALFYENYARQILYITKSDSPDRRIEMNKAYRSISIAIKLYRAAGRDEDYQRAIEIKAQIAAERS